MQGSQRKKVLCPIEREGKKTYWLDIGAAFSNRDGSLNVYLNALPTNSRLQIRDLDERDLQKKSPEAVAVVEPAGTGDLPF